MGDCKNPWLDGTCPQCGETHYVTVRRAEMKRLGNLYAEETGRARTAEAEVERLRAKLAAAEAYGEKERRHFEDWFKRAEQAEARTRDLEAERTLAVKARDNWREAHDQVQARTRDLEEANQSMSRSLSTMAAQRNAAVDRAGALEAALRAENERLRARLKEEMDWHAAAVEEEERLRAALQKYADPSNYDGSPSAIDMDDGAAARAALTELTSPAVQHEEGTLARRVADAERGAESRNRAAEEWDTQEKARQRSTPPHPREQSMVERGWQPGDPV